MGVMRIPYTDPLPVSRIIPASATSFSGAVAAITEFLTATPASRLVSSNGRDPGDDQKDGGTVLLTGAGISTKSGLADYRGTKGTYTLNKTYRPIYFHEFSARHESRKRYWARSFLGYRGLDRSKPNAGHYACGDLGELGIVSRVITQNVDSFHRMAHPQLPTTELHGYLRTTTCLTCRTEYPRPAFQATLAKLNPAWADFLAQLLQSGALDTENPEEKAKKGYKTNPDGDVDVPGVDYGTFRYPPCPICTTRAEHERSSWTLPDGQAVKILRDKDGAWLPGSNAGILKPSVIMFGESVSTGAKEAAERAIEGAERVLVIGSSLATYSAWRLIKRAKERGIPIGVLNLGGVRGEEAFFEHADPQSPSGVQAVRVAQYSDEILPEVVKEVKRASKPAAGEHNGSHLQKTAAAAQ